MSTNLKIKSPWLAPSEIVYTITGLEFTVATTSFSKVFMASSFKLDPWVLSSDAIPALADLTWPSKIPPKWLPPGWFFSHITQPLSKFCKYTLICLWPIFRKPLSSFPAPMKLLTLSDLNILAFPLHRINLLKHMVKESVSIECTTYGLNSMTSKSGTISL